MDDRAIARLQARLMRTAISNTGFSVRELWEAYVRLGGEIAELEIDAYLHHALHLPPRHRDVLVQATNQLIPRAHIPYHHDLRPQEHDSGPTG
jgi:hypothetical protein